MNKATRDSRCFSTRALAWMSPILVLLLSSVTAGRAAAQDKPHLLIGKSPKPPETSLSQIPLRPNIEQPVYFFVKNPTKQEGKFTVLVADQKAEVTVGAESTQMVKFGKPAPAPSPAPAPATPAPATAAPAAEPKPTWTELKEAPPVLTVKLLQAGGEELEKRELQFNLVPAPSYLKAPKVRFNSQGNILSAEIEAKEKDDFKKPECVVEMILPANLMTGLETPFSRDYKLRGVLKEPGETVRLFAKGLRFVPNVPHKAVIFLSVDGNEDAFVYETEFPQVEAPVNPRQKSGSYRIVAPAAIPAAEKLAVRIEVRDSPEPDEDLELAFGILNDKKGLDEKIVKDFKGDRDKKVRFSPGGPDGSLLFQMEVKDWVADIDIAGVVGKRTLRVRPKNKAEDDNAPGDQVDIIIDATPPEKVAIVEAPATAFLGAKVTVKAFGEDFDSKIREALFFLGKPPADGKLPPTVDTVTASAPDAKNLRSAAITMPADKKGPVVVSVQYVNNAGMSAFASKTITVLDPNDPKAAAPPGRIEGKVFEGDRPQVGLDVTLFDDKGKEKDKTKTKEDGAFAFEDVPAGNYSVTTAKEASVTKGLATVKVIADKTAIVAVRLYR